MNFRQLIEPSSTYQVAAQYLDYINQKPVLNPGKSAALSQCVEAFVLRRLAAFPLVIIATLDLAFIAVMSTITVLTFNAKGKHHFINLVSTLVLFPQAIGMLIFGKLPQVNYVRQIGRENGSIRELFSSKHSPEKQKLILAQLQRHDETLLTKALSEIDHYNEPFLLKLIPNNSALKLELLSFLIEKAKLATTPAHAQQPYLTLLMRFASMQRFASIDQDHGGRPQAESASNRSKYENLAKKLIDCGAAHFTRKASSEMSGSERFLFGTLNDLDRSVQAGCQSIAEMLLKIDDDLDVKLSAEEKTARNNKLLCLAAYYQKPSLIKLMLDQGADPLAQFNETCAWELALYSHSTESIQILLETGKIDPNSPLPGRGMMMPLDFSLFGFSNTIHTVDGPRRPEARHTTSEASREKRLESAKILLRAGAMFNAADLEDERFTQTLNCLLSNNMQALKALENEKSPNSYPMKLALLSSAMYEKSTYLRDVSRFLAYSLPKLTAEKQAITKANTPLIQQTIPAEANIIEPLAEIISEYYYS